jgi:hypothetical protein
MGFQLNPLKQGKHSKEQL